MRIISILLIASMTLIASAQTTTAMKNNENQPPLQGKEQLCTYKSLFTVKETVKKIEAHLKEMNVPVFAKYDHSANAQSAGLSLEPNEVIVFGAPKVGTLLMKENPRIAIELPLRMLVWQDAAGCVWISFPQMKELAARYGLENHPVVDKMQKMLEQLATQAGS